MKTIFKRSLFTQVLLCCVLAIFAQDSFPDGTPVSEWFRQTKPIDMSTLGNRYCITDYEVVNDSTILQTQKIQAVIDKAHQQGGGVIVVPQGTFLSGSLFFKPKTHLYIEKGGTLKGSDDISDFPLVMTRMEGQTVKYFVALVNADKVDGFTISGEGCINGNGLRYWKSFWLRTQFNPKCTNMDEMRPRLIYVSNSKHIQLSGLKLMHSPYWTTHFYKCENIRFLNLHITSPNRSVGAPSTDAIDLDVCTNVHIKKCYMSVNDDALSLKGGKGPHADNDKDNGINQYIIVENCRFGPCCHSAFTCGSESVHSKNIIFRDSQVDGPYCVVNLKMRPDTPQHYEYILVENIKGNANRMLNVSPWTQFFDLKGEKDIKISRANNLTFRNIQLDCINAATIKSSEQYELFNFTFENLKIEASENPNINTEAVNNFIMRQVEVNGKIKTL